MSVLPEKEKLEAAKSEITKQIRDVEDKLHRYEVDVAEIKRIHKYEENVQTLKSLQEKRDDITKQIYCVSLNKIGSIICEALNTIETYKLSEKDFWSYLNSTLDIMYREDGATPGRSSFSYFYTEALKDIDDIDSFMHFPNADDVKIKYFDYFRGEIDNTYEFLVPIQILHDIESCKSSIEQYITERKTEASTLIAAREAEREKAEYELYLKLKKKYEENPED